MTPKKLILQSDAGMRSQPAAPGSKYDYQENDCTDNRTDNNIIICVRALLTRKAAHGLVRRLAVEREEVGHHILSCLQITFRHI